MERGVGRGVRVTGRDQGLAFAHVLACAPYAPGTPSAAVCVTAGCYSVHTDEFTWKGWGGLNRPVWALYSSGLKGTVWIQVVVVLWGEGMVGGDLTLTK